MENIQREKGKMSTDTKERKVFMFEPFFNFRCDTKMQMDVVTCEPKEFLNRNIHHFLPDSLNNSGIGRIHTKGFLGGSFSSTVEPESEEFPIESHMQFHSFTTLYIFFIFLRGARLYKPEAFPFLLFAFRSSIISIPECLRGKDQWKLSVLSRIEPTPNDVFKKYTG